MIVDFIIEHLSTKRRLFAKAKYINSEDFSDLKDRLEEVKRQRNMQYLDLGDDEPLNHNE